MGTTCAHLALRNFILITLVKGTNYGGPHYEIFSIFLSRDEMARDLLNMTSFSFTGYNITNLFKPNVTVGDVRDLKALSRKMLLM